MGHDLFVFARLAGATGFGPIAVLTIRRLAVDNGVNARLSNLIGVLDDHALEHDGTREVTSSSHFKTPADRINALTGMTINSL
jgi:hypothetical protein